MRKSESIMGGDAGISPRKAMASGMGDGAGNFGVESHQAAHGGPSEIHPDQKVRTGAKGAVADGERGIGAAIHHTKGHLPAQAAPDHGPTHPGGHMSKHGHGGSAVKV